MYAPVAAGGRESVKRKSVKHVCYWVMPSCWNSLESEPEKNETSGELWAHKVTSCRVEM